MKKIILFLKNFSIWLFNLIFQPIRRIISTIMLFLGIWYAIIIFAIFNKVTVSGRRNLPRGQGPVLFLSNHKTFIDSFLIGLGIFNPLDFLFNYRKIPYNVAASEFFFNSKLKKIIFGLLKCKPMLRKTSNLPAFEKSVREMANILQKESLMLFFEGGRERHGKIDECKPGVPLVIRLSLPITIVPIFLDGIDDVLPIKQDDKRLRLHDIKTGKKIRVIIGQPIDFSDIPVISEAKEILRSKEPFPSAMYSAEATEINNIIKARVKEKVAALDPKRIAVD